MRRLYLIRHGETDFNRRNIVQGGGVDADLNDHGRKQSRLFFEKYKHIPFDLVCFTGLKRTKQTVEPFLNQGIQSLEVLGLNELNWGEIEGQEATDEIRSKFESVNAAWDAGLLHTRMQGGETPVEAWNRCKQGIEQILSQLPAGGSALVCTHGRVSRIILSEMLGYGLQHMNRFPHHNTALNLLEERPMNRWYVERLNDIDHLT